MNYRVTDLDLAGSSPLCLFVCMVPFSTGASSPVLPVASYKQWTLKNSLSLEHFVKPQDTPVICFVWINGINSDKALLLPSFQSVWDTCADAGYFWHLKCGLDMLRSVKNKDYSKYLWAGAGAVTVSWCSFSHGRESIEGRSLRAFDEAV